MRTRRRTLGTRLALLACVAAGTSGCAFTCVSKEGTDAEWLPCSSFDVEAVHDLSSEDGCAASALVLLYTLDLPISLAADTIWILLVKPIRWLVADRSEE